MDDSKTAKHFIDAWQENFAKTMQDPEIMLNFSKAMGFMQQFYDSKSATTAANVSPQSGTDELYRLHSRIDEIERRIANLEKGSNKPSGKKKTT